VHRRRIALIALTLAAASLPAGQAVAGPSRPDRDRGVDSAPPSAAGRGPLAVATAGPTIGLPSGTGVHVDLGIPGACDELDAKACLLPFPNDRFTVADPSTDTGRRVQFDATSMPRNVAGVPVDPTEWNRQDGFSPSSPVLTFVPQLDLARTWGTTVDHIADLGRSQRPDAPIVVLDATTGARHPIWSELDQHPATSDDERLLIIRPATQFVEGHRYVVALRRLRDHHGDVIPASPLFRAYRDGTQLPGSAPDDAEGRRPHVEQLLSELGAAGIERGDLFLMWDFTVASTRNLTERVLRMRDDAFARLGDTDLADGTIQGAPPAFTITKVEELPEGPTLRNVRGTVRVPNYLTPQVTLSTELPDPIGNVGEQVVAAKGQLPKEILDALKPVTGAVPISADDVLTNGLTAPLGRLNTAGSPDGLPVVNPLQPTLDVPFVCSISRSSLEQPSHPAVYGHGLLGHRDETTGSSTVRLRERGFTPCGVDWYGFAFVDIANVAHTLLDISGMASVMDSTQQGFVNGLYLGRLLSHPDGLASAAAFRGPDGRPLIRTGELVFAGNSQGAIMGGALTALAPDWQRAVLGVPGMGYATLLNRSVDWEGEYALVFYAAYPGAIDQQLGYGLLQMLWDRGETSGYAQQLTTRPLPGTPPHEVFLQVAFGDHQVTNVMAEVEARTIGAKLRTPVLADGRHWAIDPTFGFRTISGDVADVGSVLVYWYANGLGLATPPNGNLPDQAGTDPHGAPRKDPVATDQVARWLLTGDFVDVCGRGPCELPAPR
jgi:hypothetical protein